MSQPEKVLVAVDFSEYSDDSVEVAGKLATCLGGELVALNVVNQRLVEELRFIEGTTELLRSDEVVAQRVASRRERLEQLLAGHGLRGRVLVRVGVPWETILETAEQEGAQYIVMGTKGRSDIARTLLGSNADKLYRHSPVTLVSVRGGRHRAHLAKARGQAG